jgi:hypothetical protein
MILGLEDCHPYNVCAVWHNDLHDIRIIDFAVPRESSEEMRIPDNFEDFCRWLLCSGLISLVDDVCVADLKAAFDSVKNKLKRIPTRGVRLFVYPNQKESTSNSSSLKNFLEGEREREVEFVDLENFLKRSLLDICKFFFVDRMDEKDKDIFGDRSFGELFGFSGNEADFRDLCECFSGDVEESKFNEMMRREEEREVEVKTSGLGGEEGLWIRGKTAVHRLECLHHFLLWRVSRFTEMMEEFLERCSSDGIESFNIEDLKKKFGCETKKSRRE